MAKFHVLNTFELHSREFFVMVGSIVEGVIRAGMFLLIPLNSSLNLSLRIHSIEFALTKNGEFPCICVKSEPEIMKILSGLNIQGETFDISIEGSS